MFTTRCLPRVLLLGMLIMLTVLHVDSCVIQTVQVVKFFRRSKEEDRGDCCRDAKGSHESLLCTKSRRCHEALGKQAGGRCVQSVLSKHIVQWCLLLARCWIGCYNDLMEECHQERERCQQGDTSGIELLMLIIVM